MSVDLQDGQATDFVLEGGGLVAEEGGVAWDGGGVSMVVVVCSDIIFFD
jgi:hypothetical protein